MLFQRIQPFLLPISWLALLVLEYCRIQHITESRLPVQLAYGSVGFFYAIRYWNKKGIRYTDTVKCVLIVFWCALQTSFASGVRFDRLVFYTFFLLGALWFILELIDLFKGRTKGYRLLLLFGGMLMGLRLVMRVFHYPGAAVIMVLAYMVVTVGFVSELVEKIRQV